MRLPRAVFWVLGAIVLAGAFYGIVIIRHGFSAKDQPSLIETFVARSARRFSIPSASRNEKNPFAGTPENIKTGREHYADHCAVCHSNDGSGDSEIGPNLYPKAPDIRLAETQNLTDAELFYIINNGVRLTGMPGWGGAHSTDDTWKLVLFIRHLPKLSDDEKEDMEKFNPKSAFEGSGH